MFDVHSAAFSRAGKRIVSGDTGFETVAVWDPQSRERVLTLPAIVSIFYSTEFSPHGDVLMGPGYDGTANQKAYFWRAPSWEEIARAEAAEAAAAKAPAPPP